MTANKNDGDWLDGILEAPHVDDDGFADRVARSMPAPRQRRSGPVVPFFWCFGLFLLFVGVSERALHLDVDLALTSFAASFAATSLSSKVLLVLGTGLAALAAAFSGEALKLSPRRLALSSSIDGPALAGMPSDFARRALGDGRTDAATTAAPLATSMTPATTKKRRRRPRCPR